MNRPLVDQIADAVLYEGYLLYPYRPSVKNRQRWTFGGLYPRAYSDAQAGTDPWMSQTECLVHSGDDPRLSLRVRFLHLQLRRVESDGPAPARAPLRAFRTPGRRRWSATWTSASTRWPRLADRPEIRSFAFPSRRQEEPLTTPDGRPRGTVIREQESVAGSVELSAERVADSLFKVTVRVRNDTPLADTSRSDRDWALLHALVSTHAILGMRDGEFLSMIDPPEPWRDHAAGCRNVGAWPVLVGEPGASDTMLSAPIILYDYPQIAPESPGDLFDATEIDEILTLRILTLTDEEKRAMSDVNDRAPRPARTHRVAGAGAAHGAAWDDPGTPADLIAFTKWGE